MPNIQMGEIEPIAESKFATMSRDEQLIAYGGVIAELAFLEMTTDFEQNIAEGGEVAVRHAVAQRQLAELDSLIGDISWTPIQESVSN